MIVRNERGALSIKTLDVDVLFEGLFAECRTGKEVEWVYEQLNAAFEGAREEADERVGTQEDES